VKTVDLQGELSNGPLAPALDALLLRLREGLGSDVLEIHGEWEEWETSRVISWDLTMGINGFNMGYYDLQIIGIYIMGILQWLPLGFNGNMAGKSPN